jgi:hypothetical protein
MSLLSLVIGRWLPFLDHPVSDLGLIQPGIVADGGRCDLGYVAGDFV